MRKGSEMKQVDWTVETGWSCMRRRDYCGRTWLSTCSSDWCVQAPSRCHRSLLTVSRRPLSPAHSSSHTHVLYYIQQKTKRSDRLTLHLWMCGALQKSLSFCNKLPCLCGFLPLGQTDRNIVLCRCSCPELSCCLSWGCGPKRCTLISQTPFRAHTQVWRQGLLSLLLLCHCFSALECSTRLHSTPYIIKDGLFHTEMISLACIIDEILHKDKALIKLSVNHICRNISFHPEIVSFCTQAVFSAIDQWWQNRKHF